MVHDDEAVDYINSKASCQFQLANMSQLEVQIVPAIYKLVIKKQLW